MMQIAGVLIAGVALGVFLICVRSAVKIGGRWYAWKRASVVSSQIVANAHRRYRHTEGKFFMAPIYKHGGHRIPLHISAGAAGAAGDGAGSFTYDGEAAAILGTVDQALDVVLSAVLVAAATIAAVATNNFSIRLTHYSVAGVIKNRVLLANVGAGLAFTAGVPVDLSGAVAGNLTNPTGKTILGQNWILVAGDSIVAERVTNGTGQATPGITCTIKVGALGA